jgi:NitT/TauT family transport system ATP-binding protein
MGGRNVPASEAAWSSVSSRVEMDPGTRPEPGPRAATPDGAAVSIENLSYRYGDQVVLEGLDMEVAEGEIFVLIGPSGCGKSTILNLICGILTPSAGRLTCLGDTRGGLSQQVSYMTQKDTLLPWRDALDNAALPLELDGVSKKERRVRAAAVLEKVGLTGSENKRPHQLSGGMRARLSLARALLSDKPVFLMDEPFAAVDALRRVRLQQLLVELWGSTGKTLVYVTHDLDEAVALGHRVAVMSAHPGRIALERTITAPQPRDVARFKSTAEAQEVYLDLWNCLEEQFDR